MKKRKTVFVALGSLTAALCLGAGIWAGLRYWTGEDFVPGESDRALRKNQVLFQQDQDPQATMDQDGGEDSARWEKDLQAENQDSPQLDQNGNFLFRTDNSQLSGSTGGILDENGQPAGDGGELPDHIFTPGGDGGENVPGGNTSGGTGGNGGNAEEVPSDWVPPKDPENPDKGDPPADPWTTDVPFDENTFDPNSWWDDFTAAGYIRQNEEAEFPLYVGQSVDERTIFNSLVTSFLDSNWQRCLLNWSHYGKYIRIVGVSFDQGSSWTEQFPVTIPEGMVQFGMYINVEYRFHNRDGEPWSSMWVSYEPFASRVLCLSREPERGTDTVDAGTILNVDRQYLSLGDTLNLTQYQPYMLYGESFDCSMLYKPLTKLFPGWWENGKKVPMLYSAGYGRHVLIPGKLVNAPKDVTICLGAYAVDGEDLILQTLIDGTPDADGTLRVPNYVQAVQMDGETVEKMVLSSSVVLLPNSDISQPITVTKAFEVEAGNPFFSAQDGLLLDAAGTTLLGVPASVSSLTVSQQINVLRPLRSNSVEALHLQGETLPKIDFDCFPKLTDVYVTQEILDSMLLEDVQALEDAGITIRTEDEITYREVDGFLLDSNQGVRRILNTDVTKATLPKEAEKLCSGAFAGASGLVTLEIPAQIENLEMEQGCFADSGLRILLCTNEEQVRNLTESLKKIGEEHVFAAMVAETADHYRYIALPDGTARLVSAPANVTEFTGVAGLTVSEIAEGAFAGCTSLRWADVPERVALVETQAFSGCVALEGIIFRYTNSTETDAAMTVETNAFENCTGLRFVAYSAMRGDVSDELGTDVSCCGYWPSGAQGYPTSWDYAPVQWITTDPFYKFYTNDGLDAMGERLLVTQEEGGIVILRSGRQVPEQLMLPTSVTEIGPYAFEDVSESFQINWEQCSALMFVDPYAFKNSGLTGDVVLNSGYASVMLHSFYGTDITAFSGNTVDVGREVFTGCALLETASFTLPDGGEMYGGLFAGCNALKQVTMGNTEPFRLILPGESGFPFYMKDYDEENLLYLPEEAREACVQEWLYLFAGYATEDELRAAVGQYISDPEELEAETERMLLESENRIRKLLVGMEPEEENDFTVEENGGYLTLTQVPEDAVDVVLNWQTLKLTEGTGLDYIGTGAFAGCTQLERVTVCEGLSGIYSGAFPTGGEQLELVLEGTTPPTLILAEDGSFSFGLADEKIHLTVPETVGQDYLNHWKANLAGFVSYADALAAMKEEHAQWSAEKVKWTVDRQLRSGENRLRAMMGLENAAEDYGTEPVRDGVRLFGVPTGAESVVLDASALGAKLLEINADAFQNCDLLKKVVLPDTVDAITAKAFTCATDGMTLDMTAWTKDKTPPTLVLLDDEPFTFGLTKGDEKLEIRVANEEVKQRFVEAWAPFFAGAESKEALVEKLSQAYLTAEKTELTQEEQQAVTAEAESLLSQARAALNERITYYIPENEDTGMAEETEK